jgi:hypothetical protein
MDTQDAPAPPISLFRHDDRNKDGIPSHRILDVLEERRQAAQIVENRKKLVKRIIFTVAGSVFACLFIGVIFVAALAVFDGEDRDSSSAATQPQPANAPETESARYSDSPSALSADFATGNKDTAEAPSKNPLKLLLKKEPQETPQADPLRALSKNQDNKNANASVVGSFASKEKSKKEEKPSEPDPLMSLVEEEEKKLNRSPSESEKRIRSSRK